MDDSDGDFKPVRNARSGRKSNPYDEDIPISGVALEPIDLKAEMVDGPKGGEEDEAVVVGAHGKIADAAAHIRRISVPRNRLTPLQKNWVQLLDPIVRHVKLQARFNTKRKCVEIRSPQTQENADAASLDKAVDYVRAFLLGFALQDAIALLRLDDIYLQSFQVTDVKRLRDDNLSRAIGRISGKDGKTKYAIENATRTRIVVSDKRVHLLGGHQNITLARDSICSLILGSSPGKVHNHLRIVSRRMKERA